MAYYTDRTFHVVNQPVISDPFSQLDGKWTVNLCNCFDDISRCTVSNKI
jgi:hypothetical protein